MITNISKTMEAGLGANPNKIKNMDFIQVLNFVESLQDGKEVIKAIRFIGGFRNSSHNREIWDAIDRLYIAHCPDQKNIPDKEFK